MTAREPGSVGREEKGEFTPKRTKVRMDPGSTEDRLTVCTTGGSIPGEIKQFQL